MNEFADKVAIITGAASGIGRGLAIRCAQEGIKIVLADIEEPALTETARDLRAKGATTLSVQTDVSKIDDIKELAQKTINTFGEVHLLFNNAGVGAGTTVWESPLVDWEWVIGVNLFGVIYGIQVFVPIMLEQETDCHIVNTASAAGLLSGPGLGIYKVTKHGVVSLSETLYYELKERDSKINVSVLCPGFVKTRIVESERNRPAELQADPSVTVNPDVEANKEEMAQAVQAGISPKQVADIVFKAIREKQLYILTHPGLKVMIQQRMENIIQECNPD